MSQINIPENYHDFSEAIKTIVRIGKQITDKHIEKRNGAVWDYTAQISRIHEEVSEVYRELRKNNPREPMVQEIIDVFCSTITLMNIQKVTDKEIDDAVHYVLEKLYYRTGILH